MALVKELGNPIITTSAKCGDDDFFDASLLHDYYKGQLDIVIDGGPVPAKPSSVISLMHDEPEVIREGQGDVSIFV